MKAKTLAQKLMDVVKKHGEDVIVDTFDDIDIIKPYPGCRGSGTIVYSISTEDDEDYDE